MPKGIPQPGRTNKERTDAAHAAKYRYRHSAAGRAKERAYKTNYGRSDRGRAVVAANRRSKRGRPGSWVVEIIQGIRRRSKEYGYPCTITGQDILGVIPSDYKCPVLGLPLIFGGKQSSNSPSVDCIDPRLRYVKGNIRVISMRANLLKSDVTDAEELQKVVDDLRRQY